MSHNTNVEKNVTLVTHVILDKEHILLQKRPVVAGHINWLQDKFARERPSFPK